MNRQLVAFAAMIGPLFAAVLILAAFAIAISPFTH